MNTIKVDYPTLEDDHDCMDGECTHIDGIDEDFPGAFDSDWWEEQRERNGRY